jgi:outer membrane receptor for ferrienterochelin and colicin
MKELLLIFLLLASGNIFAQQKLVIVVKDAAKNIFLPNASVLLNGSTKVTDENGLASFYVFNPIPIKITVSSTGYFSKKIILNARITDTIIAALEAMQEELEEVKVLSTRSGRSIQAIPTRVEVIAGEELDEKSNMSPSNITMLLRESTGIQVQQTSAVSGNASFRLQGLPGRYTQLLKDGFPLYSGYSGGLSLLQVPPLDLKQVEVIKGSASTLYGGGAIAGLVNLVTKQPLAKRETQFFVNATTAGGFDANAFHSQQLNKVGIQLYATYNTQRAFDAAGVGFSALPKQEKFNFNPKLFYHFSSSSKLMIAANYSSDNRLGGNMNYIKTRNATNAYFENNESTRFSAQVTWQKHINQNTLTIKNSVNTFNNKLMLPTYIFGGKQTGSYSEVSYNINDEKSDWVIGTNIWTDEFNEEVYSTPANRNYSLFTAGAFIQNVYKASDKVSIETGVRSDYNSLGNSRYPARNDLFILPRLSMLFIYNPHFSSRIGAGLGYKMPTIFTEESEAVSYKNVQTINLQNVQPERSTGFSSDLYYKGRIEALSINFNQLFFYTRVKKPLMFDPSLTTQNVYSFMNAPSYIDSRGFESQLKLKWQDITLFSGYTFLDTRRTYLNNSPLPFAAKHRLLMTLMYDEEENLKMGFESSFTGAQTLTDGRKARSYWTVGYSAEKLWKHFSLYINFENFSNTRQTKWEPFYTGPSANPTFTEVYAPIDGFIMNTGIKIRL